MLLLRLHGQIQKFIITAQYPAGCQLIDSQPKKNCNAIRLFCVLLVSRSHQKKLTVNNHACFQQARYLFEQDKSTRFWAARGLQDNPRTLNDHFQLGKARNAISHTLFHTWNRICIMTTEFLVTTNFTWGYRGVLLVFVLRRNDWWHRLFPEHFEVPRTTKSLNSVFSKLGTTLSRIKADNLSPCEVSDKSKAFYWFYFL